MRSNGWTFVLAMTCLALSLAASAQMGGGGGMGAMGSSSSGKIFEGNVNLPWALQEGKTHLNPGTYYVKVEQSEANLFLLISKDARHSPILRVMGRNVPAGEADRMVTHNSLDVALEDAGGSAGQRAAVFVLRRREGSMNRQNSDVQRWEFKLDVAPTG